MRVEISKKINSYAGKMRVLLAAVLLSSSPVSAGNEISSEIMDNIDKLITTEMSGKSIPGISIAIAVDKKLILQKGYGLADVENFVPVTKKTLFRVASIDKWMTATAAMKLVEEGRLSLSEEVQKYCPAYPKKRWRMNVHHLLNHSAGIRHYWGSNNEPNDTDAQKEALKKKIKGQLNGGYIRYTDVQKPLLMFSADPLLFKPGSKFKYTSHGYRLLGCVLEGASGEKYTDLMQRAVFRPAGMVDIIPDDSHAVIPHRVSGYSLTKTGKLRRADFRDVSDNLPAGGNLSTPSDIIRFMSEYVWGDLLTPKSHKIIRKRPAFSAASDRNFYGFGVGVSSPKQGSFKDMQVLFHAGGQAGTATVGIIIPKRGIAISVFMNNDEASAMSVAESILKILTAKDVKE